MIGFHVFALVSLEAQYGLIPERKEVFELNLCYHSSFVFDKSNWNFRIKLISIENLQLLCDFMKLIVLVASPCTASLK